MAVGHATLTVGHATLTVFLPVQVVNRSMWFEQYLVLQSFQFAESHILKLPGK